MPFLVVGVQQALGRPAVHLGGDLPAEVHRVADGGADALAVVRVVDVRGVAREEDAALAVALGVAGDDRVVAQPVCLGRLEFRPGEPPHDGAQLLQGRRSVLELRRAGGELGAEHAHRPGVERGTEELVAVRGVRQAVLFGRHVRAVDRDVADDPPHDHPVVPDVVDACPLADQAVPSVAAHQVAARQPLLAGVRNQDSGDAGAVGRLLEAGEPGAPAQVHAEFEGPVDEGLLQAGLQHHVGRLAGPGHLVEGQRQVGEADLGEGDRALPQPVGEAPLVQQFQGARVDRHGRRLEALCGMGVHEDRGDVSHGQFAGEHQTGGPGSHDDDRLTHDRAPSGRT